MRRALLILLPTALFAACGGGAATGGADMKAPESRQIVDQDRDPSSIEEAKQQLDRAVARMEPQHLEAVQPQNPSGAGGGGGGGGAVAPVPHPPPTTQETECARMCRAFASMQRAQTALCRMAGDEDARCAEAKKVVEDNAKRVAHCGCH